MRIMQFSSGTKRSYWIRLVLALAVATMGVINGLAVLLPPRPERLSLFISILDELALFEPSVWSVVKTGRTIALIIGFFLVFIAWGLARGKQRAWQIAMVLLSLSVVADIAKGLEVEDALLALAPWSALLTTRAFFQVKSDPWKVRQGIVLLVCGFILLFLYSLSGVYLLQDQLLMPDTLDGVLHSLLKRVVNLPTRELLPLTHHAAWFLQSIPWLSATALLTGMIVLLRPVSVRWWVRYQKMRILQTRQEAVELVRHYGNHPLAFFALAPGNLYYLAPEGEGLINYQLAGSTAVVLGDPVCPPQAFERVIRGFLDMCELHDWRVAFYQAHPEHLSTYHALGLYSFKIGEEASICPQTFTLSGSAMANVRTSSRRAEREGVVIQWYEGVPPEQVVEQLQRLSCTWLECKAGKHATEMGFSMGRFDDLAGAAARAEMVAGAKLAEGMLLKEVPHFVTGVAYDSGGNACAFVTFTPLYGSQASLLEGIAQMRWGWALDLMRRLPDAPPGVIELLLVRAVDLFRDRGAGVVSLGMVAMADTKQEMTTNQQHMTTFISDHLRLLESHRTLFHFKQKFHPSWESRYIIVSTVLDLPKSALAILRIHRA